MPFNIPDTGQKRVVIVGGGFGGLTLARKLSRSDFQVVLVDKPRGAVAVEIVTSHRGKADRASVGISAQKRQIDAAAYGEFVGYEKPGQRRDGNDGSIKIAGVIDDGKTGRSADQNGAFVRLCPGLEAGEQKTCEEQ